MRSASLDPSMHRARPAELVGLAAAWLVHWLAYRPGIVVWDSIRQYRQALSGQYDNWHPPAMNWLWHMLTRFAAGPAPMLVLQLTLYWGGIGLLAAAALARRRRLLAVAIVALASLPMELVLEGTILKDSLMAGCLLAAAGILALRPEPGLVARVAAAVLLVAAATLRFNAVPAIVPLALAAMPRPWTATRARLVATGIGLALALLTVMPLANRLLDARSSGVEYSLITYDLGGITYYSGTNVFPPMPPVTDPREINARCYDSISWDRYAWWGPDPCPIGFSTVRDSFAASGRNPTAWWLGAIAAHPLAYAQHRLGHFNRNIRLWTRDSALPALSLRSDPNDWNLAVAPNRLSIAIARWATLSETTPLGWPAWWIALGCSALALWPAARDRGIATPLLWSGLLYALSFLPLSVASEVRYHLWTMLALGIGAVHLFDEHMRSPARTLRIAGTVAVVVVVTAICLAARA